MKDFYPGLKKDQLPGGLGIATVAANAIFAAVTGRTGGSEKNPKFKGDR